MNTKSSARPVCRAMEVETFRYAAGPDDRTPDWLRDGFETKNEKPSTGPAETPPAVDLAAEERIVKERARSLEEGRLRGWEAGAAAERERIEQNLKRELARLVENFAAERDRYLRTAEKEVVKLAIAIAERILRREAQIDPLLLTGAVRVALGQLSAKTRSRLRVPSAHLQLWKEAIALVPNLPVQPEVVEGEGMMLGDCVLETQSGSIDLSARAQLEQLERGLLERDDGNGTASAIDGDREEQEP